MQPPFIRIVRPRFQMHTGRENYPGRNLRDEERTPNLGATYFVAPARMYFEMI